MGQQSEPPKEVVIIESNMLMHTVFEFIEKNFTLKFGQSQWTMQYGSIIKSLVYSLVYLKLRYCQDKGLITFHKP